SLARRRLRGVATPGLTSLLRNYVRERQRMLRHMRFGSSLAVTSLALSFVVLLDGVQWQTVLLAGAATILAVSVVRSTARIIALSHPEAAASRLAAPVFALQALFRPLSWAVSAPVTVPLRALGLTGTSERIDPGEELVGALEAADEDAVLI